MKTFKLGDVVQVTHLDEYDEEHDLEVGMVGTVVYESADNTTYFVEFEGFKRGWRYKTTEGNTWCLGARKLSRVGDVQPEHKKTWVFSGIEVGGTPNDRIYGSLVYSPSEDQYYIIEHDGREFQFEIEPFDIRLESAPTQKVICKSVQVMSYDNGDNIDGQPSMSYNTFLCPHCGDYLREDWVCCPHCRTELDWKEPLEEGYER